jgi:hypothetical protein
MNNRPVAYRYEDKSNPLVFYFTTRKNKTKNPDVVEIPLYTHPVREITAEEQRKYFSFELANQVLTDQEISDTYRLDDHNGITEFSRYIESMVIEKLKVKELTDEEITEVITKIANNNEYVYSLYEDFEGIEFSRVGIYELCKAILRKAQEK